MNLIYAFVAGAVVGAIVMIFVYKNNATKMKALAEEAELKYKKLEAAVKEKARKG